MGRVPRRVEPLGLRLLAPRGRFARKRPTFMLLVILLSILLLFQKPGRYVRLEALGKGRVVLVTVARVVAVPVPEVAVSLAPVSVTVRAITLSIAAVSFPVEALAVRAVPVVASVSVANILPHVLVRLRSISIVIARLSVSRFLVAVTFTVPIVSIITVSVVEPFPVVAIAISVINAFLLPYLSIVPLFVSVVWSVSFSFPHVDAVPRVSGLEPVPLSVFGFPVPVVVAISGRRVPVLAAALLLLLPLARARDGLRHLVALLLAPLRPQLLLVAGLRRLSRYFVLGAVIIDTSPVIVFSR